MRINNVARSSRVGREPVLYLRALLTPPTPGLRLFEPARLAAVLSEEYRQRWAPKQLSAERGKHRRSSNAEQDKSRIYREANCPQFPTTLPFWLRTAGEGIYFERDHLSFGLSGDDNTADSDFATDRRHELTAVSQIVG